MKRQQQFSLPPAVREGSSVPVFLSTLVIVCLFGDGRLTEVVSPCGLDLHFLVTKDVEHLLMSAPAVCLSLEKQPFKSSAH